MKIHPFGPCRYSPPPADAEPGGLREATNGSEWDPWGGAGGTTDAGSRSTRVRTCCDGRAGDLRDRRPVARSPAVRAGSARSSRSAPAVATCTPSRSRPSVPTARRSSRSCRSDGTGTPDEASPLTGTTVDLPAEAGPDRHRRSTRPLRLAAGSLRRLPGARDGRLVAVLRAGRTPVAPGCISGQNWLRSSVRGARARPRPAGAGPDRARRLRDAARVSDARPRWSSSPPTIPPPPTPAASTAARRRLHLAVRPGRPRRRRRTPWRSSRAT